MRPTRGDPNMNGGLSAAALEALSWSALLPDLPVSGPVLAVCFLVMAGASVVFGTSGFGASLITVPLLSQFVPLPLLLSMTVVTDLMSACIVALTARAGVRARGALAAPAGLSVGAARIDRRGGAVDVAELVRLAVPALFGATLGVTLLVGLPRDASMLALGLFLLAYGVWTLRSRISDTPLSARWSLPFGFSGGMLGTLFGIGGPPYVIYLTRRILDKDRLRATIGVTVLLSLLIRFIVFLMAGLLLQPGLPTMLIAVLPVCVVGVLVGTRLAGHLSRERLLRFISLLLAGSGAILIARAITHAMA